MAATERLILISKPPCTGADLPKKRTFSRPQAVLSCEK